MQTTLFHGGYEFVSEIRIGGESNLFDGVFCSASEQTARSHGDVVTEIEIDDAAIAGNRELLSGIATAIDTVRAMLRYSRMNERQITELAEAACSDTESDLFISMSGNGVAYRSWEKQRVRGHIARALGFEAVEMDDEHGVSYLVLSFD